MSSSTQALFINCAITLGAPQTWNVGGFGLYLSGSAAVNNGGNLLTITTANTTATIGTVISGAGGLTFSTTSGSGSLSLSGANMYSGVTTIDGGSVFVTTLANVNTASSFGKGSVAGSAADLVLAGGSLYAGIDYNGTTAISTNRLFTIGDANGRLASLENSASAATSTMSFTGTGAIAFGGSGSRTLELGGSNTGNNTFAPILGDGAGGATTLAKGGTGTWIITGANTYTGGTSIAGGTLTVNTGGTLGASSSSLFIDNTAGAGATILNLNVDQTVSSLTGFTSGTATVTINLASTKTLTVNQSTTSTYSAVLAGAGSVTKSSTGTLTLSGANTYTGVTALDGGTLIAGSLANVNTASAIGAGSVAGSAADLVFGGGTLKYAGTTSATSTEPAFHDR